MWYNNPFNKENSRKTAMLVERTIVITVLLAGGLMLGSQLALATWNMLSK